MTKAEALLADITASMVKKGAIPDKMFGMPILKANG